MNSLFVQDSSSWTLIFDIFAKKSWFSVPIEEPCDVRLRRPLFSELTNSSVPRYKMSSASKHPLRKSCGFCRSRKIKCSNETICEACRKQGVDCIYDFEPYQPPSRYASRQSQQQADTIAVRTDRPNENDRSSRGSVLSAPPNIAAELDRLFQENFSVGSNGRQPRGASRSPSVEYSTPSFRSHTTQYAGLFSILTEDLVAMIVNRFGSLGCHLIEGGGAKFLINGLRRDHTDTMFDPEPLDQSPLAEYGNRKTTQLIDVWFSNHPLSFLLSKTLMMHELRGETLDEVLLSTVLADANFFIGDDSAVTRGQLLLRYATTKLHTHQPGARQSILPHPTISTVQALTLLGWNALCQSQIRRATCYISLAGRLATDLKNQKYSSTATGAGSRINGIDICEVEKEMMAYLWWINFILSQWISMQTNQKLPHLPQASLESVFLPIDAASSVLIQLDEASDNLSTLQKQKAALLDIWPLAHVSSVIAYIYGLYSQEGQANGSSETVFWQETPTHIHNSPGSHNLEVARQQIYRVLIESIHVLDTKISHVPSRALVLAVYHTIAIHTLFPSSAGGFVDSALTGDFILQFCASAEEIIRIVTSQEITYTEPLLRTTTLQVHPSSPEVFTLSLDTCARALSTINSRKGFANNLELYTLYQPRLQTLATCLDEVAQEFSSQGPPLRAVRRHIKNVILEFGINSPIANYHLRSRSSSSLSASSSSLVDQDIYTQSARTISQPQPMASSLTSSPLNSEILTPALIPIDFQPGSLNRSTSMPVEPQNNGPMGDVWFQPLGKNTNHSHGYEAEFHAVNMRDIDKATWFQDEPAMMDFDLNTMELNEPVIWQNWATLA
ncbi:hypothetical protein F4776DRAFT_639049 [Hypoxylon sp. NC0597]|nr:hypothetical protein F4776DRAFT_639049 [Hypoxylon sp. NC0597]